MASISLFGTSGLLSNTQSLDSTLPAGTTSQAASTPAPAEDDSVKLSETAQAKLLYTQGQSVSAIAQTLATTTKEIDSDLGITLQNEIEQTLQATLSVKG